MKKNLHIRINELTRVEGHGNVVIDLKNGKIKDLRMEIIESPRFFEAMLRGRRFDEAQHIMSRICGICAVSHTSASLKAIEDAMDIKISRQSTLLRKLAFYGETLQSHILHLFFLVMPDLVGAGSITELIEKSPDMAKTGLELKRLANEICAVVGGRHIHPISLFPGGVVHTPKTDELKGLKARLTDSFAPLEKAVEYFAAYRFPAFTMARDFVSLRAPREYAIYNGDPVSSMKYSIKSSTYTKKIKEYIRPYSTAKQAVGPAGTIMVGALARFNNNYKQLTPRAKKAAAQLGLKAPVENPFMNNCAQLVECIHTTGAAIKIIDLLIDNGVRAEAIKKTKGYGRGIGIVEAPRGTLYHEYKINKDGIVEDAVCIIPTAQNLRSIEDDLRAFVPTILDKTKEEIRSLIESLVRAYDPCISCSTHIMNVSFT